MQDRKNFKDFDKFLERFFITGDSLNLAFFGESHQNTRPDPEEGKTEASTPVSNEAVRERKNSQDDVFSPLLEANGKETYFVQEEEEKNQAAKKLYQLLEELQTLSKEATVFTAYAMMNWMEIHLATINDDNSVIQRKLREASPQLFQGTRQMAKRAALWDSRMMTIYGIAAIVGFTLVFVELPSFVISTCSPDMITDIFMNSTDLIANSFSAYRQWKLNEPTMAKVNLFGGVQSALLTSIGVIISINALITQDLQSAQTKMTMQISEQLLGVACAAGMFCSAFVEHLEYQQCMARKNSLIHTLFQVKDIANNEQKIKTFTQLNNSVELLKQCRELVETTPTLNDSVDNLIAGKIDGLLTKKITAETLVRGIAIAQAQCGDHWQNQHIFIGFSIMMTLLAVCAFYPLIEETATPFIIQGSVFLSAIIGKYIAATSNNIEKIKPFLEEKTSHDIQTKFNETVGKPYISGVIEALRVSCFNCCQTQSFYRVVENENTAERDINHSTVNIAYSKMSGLPSIDP